jgi:dipeptidyl-peptidase-3
MYAANPLQEQVISKYMQSFMSGDIEAYKESQKMWVKDVQPSVEAIFGFVEPYRDPFGVRAEFEGVVGIVNKDETKTLTMLVENSAKFIRRLPWAENSAENDGKGPFEKTLFENPDFTSLHSELLHSCYAK